MRVYFAAPLFTHYERAFIDECTGRLWAEGIEVFVPHENALAAGDTSAATIFRKDWDGLVQADAVEGCIEAAGRICGSLDEVVEALGEWRD